MRQFIASEQLNSESLLPLKDTEKRYLKNVLRLRFGESIDVRLLDGQLLEMTLVKQKTAWFLQAVKGAKPRETGVSAYLLETENENSQSFEINLLQAMTKPNKMDLIIRQATECGVKRIVPIKGDLSQAFSFEAKKERWEKIIKEARQQSGSAISTELVQAMTFEEFFVWDEKNKEKSFAEPDISFDTDKKEKKVIEFKCYLSENRKTESLFSLLSKTEKPQKIHIAVGCEGGFSKKELTVLEKNGFIPLHLSTNILRSETAAIYGLAILQNSLMEYNSWQKQE